MTTIAQVIGQTRSLLDAGLSTEIARLAQSYNPEASTIRLSTEKRIPENAVISIGGTSLITTAPATGNEFAVTHAFDGSPDTSQPVGSAVLIRPRHTNWQVFTEIAATIDDLSSPTHGLYQIVTEEQTPDLTWRTYKLAQTPLKVLRVRYTIPGSPDNWNETYWTFRPSAEDGPQVETGVIPGGARVQFVYAASFTAPSALGEELPSLGVPDSYAAMIAVGAARNLALSSESRRAQPYSQGDPRRAEEVSMGSSAMVYDRLRRRFDEMVADERTRLVQQQPYRWQFEAYGAMR